MPRPRALWPGGGSGGAGGGLSPSSSPTVTGSWTFTGATQIKAWTDATVNPGATGRTALVNLAIVDDANRIFHLTTAGTGGIPGIGPIVISVGLDADGDGLNIRNKRQGRGIVVSNQNTITHAGAHGFYGAQGSMAPFVKVETTEANTEALALFSSAFASSTATGLVRIESSAAGAPTALRLSNTNASAGQKAMEFVNTTSGVYGSIFSDTGNIFWRQSAEFRALATTADTLNTPILRVADAETDNLERTEQYLTSKTAGSTMLQVYRKAGTGLVYGYQWVAESADRYKLKASRGAAAKGAEVYSTMIEVRSNAGSGNFGQMGFFGVTPSNRAAAYTQTYSTVTRTVSAPPAALTDSSGGTSGGNTIAVVTDIATAANAIATLAAKVNAVITDATNNKQLIGSLIDDSQGYGLAQ